MKEFVGLRLKNTGEIIANIGDKLLYLLATTFLLCCFAAILTPLNQARAGVQGQANDCVENRAAFQFGPYTTRMVVAQINVCQNSIGQILESWELNLPFEDYLEGEGDKRKFSEKFLRQAINAIWLLRKKSDRHQPTVRLALVSPLLRRASNGPQLLNYFEQVGKLRVVEAELKETALMNYYAVAQMIKRGPQPRIAVWDVGASQMSMVAADENKNYKFHLDNMASITFRNWMITNLKKKTIKEKNTPNPIGQEDSVAALEFVKKYTEKQMSEEFRQNLKDKVIIGVGGVHTFLLGKMEGTTMKVNRRVLGREIRDLRQYSDRGVGGGRFASTKVSNLIMILGQMEAMGIDEYYVLNTNPLVGLLLFHNL